MGKCFDYSAWIWCNQKAKADDYGEFYDTFEYTGEHEVVAHVSADSNYALYVNGKLAAFGQYADYPYDKVYDTVDLTSYCERGKNHLAIVVWYYGLSDASCYYLGRAALRFALWEGDTCICHSARETQSRRSIAYWRGACKKITGQLGYSFSYNAAAEDNWMLGEGAGMHESVLVPQNPPLRPRPCKKLEVTPPAVGRQIATLEDGSLLFDLGREEVGLISLELETVKEQTVVISYGEHIIDGRVRRKIGSRDFSVEYRTKEGENVYVNPFRRLACRYLEISAPRLDLIKIKRIAILPTNYPLARQPLPSGLNETQKRIYEACVRTLQLCMHEHYEDCPWREQCLYAMDSRNQILCGYYAFGEYEFPRANLQLIASDNREDGLLAICYPSSFNLAIPSFSLHFITEAYEYLQYTGDKEFLRQIYPKMQSVVKVFLDHMDQGLVFPLHTNEKFRYWNFYEWREGLQGSLSQKAPEVANEPDVVLNCLLLYALQNMARVAEALEDDARKQFYLDRAEVLLPAIRNAFYDDARGVFINRIGEDSYSQLGNGLALICGVLTGDEAVALAERMIHDPEMTPTSLSMQCFTYDALLKVSEDYQTYILKDIEKTYLPMLEGGTGTVWETEIGAADFDNAGSLCHGWSALPIYYYHLFLK